MPLASVVKFSAITSAALSAVRRCARTVSRTRSPNSSSVRSTSAAVSVPPVCVRWSTVAH